MREEVSRHLRELPDEVRQDAVMAVSELVENAIKYGDTGGRPAAVFIDVSAGRLRLEVSSGIACPVAANETVERVRAINRASDKHALYLERLHAVRDRPEGPAQLGLYRIVGEGSFELDCSVLDDTLRITATRELP